jgi:hypothetical protein
MSCGQRESPRSQSRCGGQAAPPGRSAQKAAPPRRRNNNRRGAATGVGLGMYLPQGVAVEELSTEEARGVWRRISALENVPPPEANGNGTAAGGSVHVEADTAAAVASRPPARASSVPF